MDDMLDSECSSGCESGWTLYLEHSFLSPHPSKRRKTEKQSVSEDEEEEAKEEDLSMVSDASSGPRIFHEEECFGNAGNGFFCRAAVDAALLKNGGNTEQKRGNRRREVEEDDPSFLDDTASSPICNFSQNNYPLTNEEASMENALDFSQGWSATHSETNNGSTQGRSAIFHDEPFDFFQFPMSGNQLQQNQWFGRNLGMR
ncbi:protein SOB FIVE-LIKE 5-like [Rhododendron vialii]|uniref:protein SOB FIVE-LIKE 5-like n=1 Tax=Rhododendron vialii TaxID=182163 RepID=UPI00265E8615|nr:protein SOB FIVE-LIKE 5-like [Rhododendron vialii]